MKQFPGSVFSKIMKAWTWITVILLVVLIKFVALYPDFVEKYYSNGLYPLISRFLRIIFGWIPFSIGDLLYAFIAIVILVKTWQLMRAIWQKKFNRQYFLLGLKQLIFFIFFVYIIFYLFWGLNYNRRGIAHQIQLEAKQQEYSVADLDTLLVTLRDRLNEYADKIDTSQRDSTLKTRLLFSKALQAYDQAAKQFPFLNYNSRSIKVSLYTPVSHIFGFSGYYNPFSGEAQIQTQYPPFLRPFVITHEIGHQLGYAKEDEASFSGFIACRAYNDADFRYSMYFDLYISASFEMLIRDMKRYGTLMSQLHLRVRRDYKEWMDYLMRKKNFIEPFVSKFYDSYLKANNQPLGKRTYNMVTYWLIGYYKKLGIAAL